MYRNTVHETVIRKKSGIQNWDSMFGKLKSTHNIFSMLINTYITISTKKKECKFLSWL